MWPNDGLRALVWSFVLPSFFNIFFTRCCNTCEEVREAYRQKGWAFTTAQEIDQCIREGWSDQVTKQMNEGCRLYGYLEVNKVCLNNIYNLYLVVLRLKLEIFTFIFMVGWSDHETCSKDVSCMDISRWTR